MYMMDEFVQMLKKRKEKQGPVDKKKLEANASVMDSLRKMLGDDLAEGVKGAKKVMVASNSEEGLMEGLEKAEDVIEEKMGKKESEDMEEDSEDMEESEDAKEESEDSKSLKAQIAMLKQEIEDLKKRV